MADDSDDDEDDGGFFGVTACCRWATGYMPAALVPVGAARLVGSGPPSSAGTGPVEVEQLLKELFGIYDPACERGLVGVLGANHPIGVSFEDLGSQRVGCGLGADYDE